MREEKAMRRASRQSVAYDRQKIICSPGSRLLSDVEASVVPSLQVCMAVEYVYPPPTSFLRASKSHIHHSGARGPGYSPWAGRGSRLTGNVFVDHQKYGIRRLTDLHDLQRCREVISMNYATTWKCSLYSIPL